MGEIWGVLAAVFSSALGGASIGATRYIAGAVDPLALGSLRFGIGFLLLLPLVMLRGNRWPQRADWPGTAALGLLFFGLFPILFNASLHYTTAARGALALSTLPLLTLLAAALLRVESLTWRKTAGVLIAMSGVAVALMAGLAQSPAGAWRGDLLMMAAALCMALYSVWSKGFIRRSGPIPFTTSAMGVGALCLIMVSLVHGGYEPLPSLSTGHWLAIVFLGVVGGALTFYLWSVALARTTPTRVAVSVTVNPVIASLIGALILGEAVGAAQILGIVAVGLGIAVATARRSEGAVPAGG
jgi:drug/metabolite transporter (DMT)-like permease